MKQTRVLTLAVAATMAIACDAIVGPAPGRDNAATFDTVWREFDLHYSLFELKHLNWDSLGASHRLRALQVTSDSALAGEIAAMLSELRDPHVSLTAGSLTFTTFTASVPTSTAYDPSLTLLRYVPGYAISRHLAYGMAAPTVGYVRITSFDGTGWSGELDDALVALNAAKSLILDIRDNQGGFRQTSTSMAGRFVDRPEAYAYVRYRNGPAHSDFTDPIMQTVSPAGSRRFGGRVYLLVNRHVLSAAEDFVLAMKVSSRVTTVGDTTGGAAGSPLARELPNGWTYRLTEWIEYMIDGRVFEQIGLAPDVYVKRSSLGHEGRDAGMEQALALAAGVR